MEALEIMKNTLAMQIRRQRWLPAEIVILFPPIPAMANLAAMHFNP